MLPAMHPHSGTPGGGRGASLPAYQQHHSRETASRSGPAGEGLPDIIHSHNVGHALPPVPDQHQSGTTPTAAGSRHHRQHHLQGRGGRTRDSAGRSRQQRGRHRTQSTTTTALTEDEGCKEPCFKCLAVVTSLRWVLLLLSVLGVLFVVSGIVMAVLHAIGKDFLIYALSFIGLGVILVVVVVVAWKCTPTGSEPIHALFNIGDSRPQPESARRDHRPHRTRRRRDGQWHGGVMYPEFQYRRPPPSYATSMLTSQAMQAEVPSSINPSTHAHDGYSLPRSSPPSYRSRSSTIHSGVHITFPPGRGSAPNSRPPTYRFRANSHRRPRLPEDFDASSPPTAPADVAFTGPEMTMQTVQQVIGTGHIRQQSAGAAVWHSGAASVDLAQAAGAVQHRRVSSLGGRTDSVSRELSFQASQTLSRPLQSVAMPASSGDVASFRSNSHAPLSLGVQQSTEQAAGATAHSLPMPSSDIAHAVELVSRPEQGRGVDHATVPTEDQDSEPEEYNTAL